MKAARAERSLRELLVDGFVPEPRRRRRPIRRTGASCAMIMRHGESIGHSFEYVTELVVMRARETDEHFAARIWQAAEDQTKDLGPLSCQLNWARL